MSKYATEQRFGGQRARVGRAVVIAVKRHDGREGVCLRAGIIFAISSTHDAPYIQNIRAAAVEWSGLGGVIELKYFDAKTEEDLAKMPIGSWCWPPRV